MISCSCGFSGDMDDFPEDVFGFCRCPGCNGGFRRTPQVTKTEWGGVIHGSVLEIMTPEGILITK